MPSGNNIHNIVRTRVFGMARFFTLKMQRLSLLQKSRILTGQLKVTGDGKYNFLMPLAGLKLPALLPRLQNSIDEITGMATCFA